MDTLENIKNLVNDKKTQQQGLGLLEEWVKSTNYSATESYWAACLCDSNGLENDALKYYDIIFEKSCSNFPESEIAGFFVGYGSVLRNCLNFSKSKLVLEQGMILYPNNQALKSFYSLTLFSLKEYESVYKHLLESVVTPPKEHSNNSYMKALEFYSKNLYTYPET